MTKTDKRVFECFYLSLPSISDSYLPSLFVKQSFGSSFNGVKTIENLHWDDLKVAAALKRGARLMGLLFTVFD